MGWVVSTLSSCALDPHNVNFLKKNGHPCKCNYESRDDIIPDTGWILNPMTDIFKTRREDTERHKREGHVEMGAEIIVMPP